MVMASFQVQLLWRQVIRATGEAPSIHQHPIKPISKQINCEQAAQFPAGNPEVRAEDIAAAGCLLATPFSLLTKPTIAGRFVLAHQLGFPSPIKVTPGIWNWEKLWKECGSPGGPG
jgi:hypothetical protein